MSTIDSPDPVLLEEDFPEPANTKSSEPVTPEEIEANRLQFVLERAHGRRQD